MQEAHDKGAVAASQDKNRDLYLATSYLRAPEANYLLQQAQQHLRQVAENDDINTSPSLSHASLPRFVKLVVDHDENNNDWIDPLLQFLQLCRVNRLELRHSCHSGKTRLPVKLNTPKRHLFWKKLLSTVAPTLEHLETDAGVGRLTEMHLATMVKAVRPCQQLRHLVISPLLDSYPLSTTFEIQSASDTVLTPLLRHHVHLERLEIQQQPRATHVWPHGVCESDNENTRQFLSALTQHTKLQTLKLPMVPAQALGALPLLQTVVHQKFQHNSALQCLRLGHCLDLQKRPNEPDIPSKEQSTDDVCIDVTISRFRDEKSLGCLMGQVLPQLLLNNNEYQNQNHAVNLSLTLRNCACVPFLPQLCQHLSDLFMIEKQSPGACRITNLDLWEALFMLNPSQWQTLCHGMQTYPHLTELAVRLNFSDNSSTCDDHNQVNDLKNWAVAPCSRLREVYLSFFGEQVPCLETMTTLLLGQPQLEFLHMEVDSYVSLENGTAKTYTDMQRALQHHPNLRTLVLHNYRRLGRVGRLQAWLQHVLVPALLHNRVLHTLDLVDCDLDIPSLALPQLAYLRTLILPVTWMKEHDKKLLVQDLNQNKVLTRLQKFNASSFSRYNKLQLGPTLTARSANGGSLNSNDILVRNLQWALPLAAWPHLLAYKQDKNPKEDSLAASSIYHFIKPGIGRLLPNPPTAPSHDRHQDH